MSVRLTHLFKVAGNAGALIAPPAPVQATGSALPATRPNQRPSVTPLPKGHKNNGELCPAPPSDRWDDWVEYDARAWPEKVERRYTLVPTTCFNCESACGLVAYVDRA
ncbi:MAG: hypothetical protein M1118_03195, partial [Chloroflexi bacterium]|nr:hypothetical protein [Chloroflexota bacterium]